jgi:hypothetical protein
MQSRPFNCIYDDSDEYYDDSNEYDDVDDSDEWIR